MHYLVLIVHLICWPKLRFTKIFVWKSQFWLSETLSSTFVSAISLHQGHAHVQLDALKFYLDLNKRDHPDFLGIFRGFLCFMHLPMHKLQRPWILSYTKTRKKTGKNILMSNNLSSYFSIPVEHCNLTYLPTFKILCIFKDLRFWCQQLDIWGH